MQRKEKKNAEHTRMYTIFRNFLLQYSRRLLSILAQHQYNNQTTTTVICFDESLLWLCFDCCDVTSITCTVVQHKKKMRSTHACTPSFAHLSLNIHVGCCLFSHNYNQNTNIKIRSGVSTDHR